MQAFTLRILSGPMFGVDIDLPAEPVTFVVGDASLASNASATHSGLAAKDTLFIPAHADGPNFRLWPDAANEAGQTFTADILDPAATRRETLPVQQAVRVGALWLALKPADEAWTADFASAPHDAPPAPDTHRVPARPPRGKLARLAWLATSAALAAGLLYGAYVLAQPRQIRSLTSLVEPVHAAVLDDSGEGLLVLTDSRAASDWVQRTLASEHTDYANVRVTDLAAETLRLGRALDALGLPYFRVDLSVPARPRILLSRTRLQGRSISDDAIAKTLRQTAGYAREFRIERVDDTTVEAAARQALVRAAVPYERVVQNERVVFLVRGPIDDRQIVELNRAVGDFRALWGERYVRFTVKLDEDPLAERTFRSGSEGYLIDPARHWVYQAIERGRPDGSDAFR